MKGIKATTPAISFYNQLFPPSRDRGKESEIAAAYVPHVPSYMGSVAVGFEPTWITSSAVLCPAVAEYRLADWIVPHLYAHGVDTPNKVTLLNCCTVRAFCCFCAAYGGSRNGVGWLWALALLMPLQMALDGADGQMARRYGLATEFGAWLDGTSDQIFSICIAAITLWRLSRSGHLLPMAILLLVYVKIMSLGIAFMDAKSKNLHWKEMNLWQRLGTYQVLFLSYEYVVIVTTFICMEWCP